MRLIEHGLGANTPNLVNARLAASRKGRRTSGVSAFMSVMSQHGFALNG
jgi:hypothetical protein